MLTEALAKSGVVVAALDFRMPPEAPYPASLADIHYGIRWCKTQATAWGSRPDLDEFVMQYRRAGGQVDLELFEGEGEGFLTRNLTSPAAQQALEQSIAFVQQHLG